MHTVTVTTNNHSYPIHIGENLHLPDFLPQGRKLIVITDNNVNKLYGNKIDAPHIVLPAGEATKSWQNLQILCDKILSHKIDRNTVLIALGGGVIGDITGFAASILMRGLKFIQIPTTLLAQVDSSVGGKTGINTDYGKNLIGSFWQPQMVLIDSQTLNTLPHREVMAGMAEVIKYGLIADADFFDTLCSNIQPLRNLEPQAILSAIQTSCLCKADVVSQDEREGGIRAILNLGHTFGHALEAELGYDGRLLHGEAVAMGTLMAADLSQNLGLLSDSENTRIKGLFADFGYPNNLKDLVDYDWNMQRLLDHMAHDKKNVGSTKRLILLNDIGNAVIKDDIDDKAILDVLSAYLC